MLSAIGAGPGTDTRLQLHSVLTGGKRRITAELSQPPPAAAAGGASREPVLKLQKVMTPLDLRAAGHCGGSLAHESRLED